MIDDIDKLDAWLEGFMDAHLEHFPRKTRTEDMARLKAHPKFHEAKMHLQADQEAGGQQLVYWLSHPRELREAIDKSTDN